MNRIFKFLVIFCFPIDKAAGLAFEHIVGGQYATEGQFKHYVSIHGSGLCGGSLIADNVVLTAGHCVCDEKGQIKKRDYKVVAGTIYMDDPSRIVAEVVKFYMYKKYEEFQDGSAKGDIAVLRLKGLKVSTNPRLATLKLPKRGDDFSDKKAMICGFGWNTVNVTINNATRESEESGTSDNRLRYADVDIISLQKCQQQVAYRVHDVNICGKMVQRSDKQKEGVCTGDSGSSLVYKDTAIAVLSTSGTGCDESKGPSVYTQVLPYLDFVEAAIKDETNADTIN